MLPIFNNANAVTPIPQQPVGDYFYVSGEIEGSGVGYIKVVWIMDPDFSGGGLTDYGFYTRLENLFVGDQGALLAYTAGWTPTITSTGCDDLVNTPQLCNKTYSFDTIGGMINPAGDKLEAVIIIPDSYGMGEFTHTRSASVGNYFYFAYGSSHENALLSTGQLPVTELLATGTSSHPEPVKISGVTPTYYYSLQLAYDDAIDGDIIQCQDVF